MDTQTLFPSLESDADRLFAVSLALCMTLNFMVSEFKLDEIPFEQLLGNQQGQSIRQLIQVLRTVEASSKNLRDTNETVKAALEVFEAALRVSSGVGA